MYNFAVSFSSYSYISSKCHANSKIVVGKYISCVFDICTGLQLVRNIFCIKSIGMMSVRTQELVTGKTFHRIWTWLLVIDRSTFHST